MLFSHSDNTQHSASNIPQGAIRQSANKERDCLFDNIRAFLIITVVFCHLLSPLTKQPQIVQILYYFIYTFHMPAFVFISGYFSKNLDKCRENAFCKFFIPYIVVNIISTIPYMQEKNIRWFNTKMFEPRWGVWFLLAMFVWRFLLKDIVKIRFALPLTFAVGLIAGCFKEYDTYMALGRIIGFLPFFVAGYYLNSETVEKLRRIPKIITALFALIPIGIAVGSQHFKWFGYQLLYFKDDYHSNDLSFLPGLFWRAVIYLSALIMIAVFISLTPRKKSYWSKIGQNTLTVYVLHLFVAPYIKDLKLFGGYGWKFSAAMLVIAVALVLILSSKPVAFAYNKIQGWIEALIFKPKKAADSAK